MKINLLLAAGRARQWQASLADALRAHGHEIGVRIVSDAPPLPSALIMIVLMERMLSRHRQDAGIALLDGRELAAHAARWPVLGLADLVIDLTGHPVATDVRRLELLYHGHPCEEYALHALMDDSVPVLGIRDSAAPERVLSGVTAVENRRLLSAGLAAIGARATNLLLARVREIHDGKEMLSASVAPAIAPPSTSSALVRWSLGMQVSSLLKRLVEAPPQWEIAWRRAGDALVQDAMQLPARGWSIVHHEAGRFLADPFIASREGRQCLFFEEYPYATGRGLISCAEISAEGEIGDIRPVLEERHHLSYPFLIEEEGTLYMIPESAEARRIELYRCVGFPDRWEHDATLLSGIAASDATIVRHDGAYWMFCTVGKDGGSSWDCLHLFHAPRLHGPWTAHPANPVLIDANTARPGGAMFQRGGSLWRVAQDCESHYGSALSLCSVDSLTPDSFRQTLHTRIAPDGFENCIGLHSLNAHAGIEAIDLCFSGQRW